MVDGIPGDGDDMESVISSPTPTIPILGADGHVRPLEDVEADFIEFALRYYGNHVSETARRLGIGRATLYRKGASVHGFKKRE